MSSDDSVSQTPKQQDPSHETGGHKWVNDPSALLLNWDRIIPSRKLSANENSNALARLVIVLVLLRLVLHTDSITRTLMVGFIALMFSSLVSFEPAHHGQDHVVDAPTPQDNNMPDRLGSAEAAIGDADPDIPLSFENENRVAVGVQGGIGRSTVRTSDESRIFSTRPAVFEETASDDEMVNLENTVGMEKFVSRMM